MVGQAGGDDLEGVERVSVAGGVHPGVQNAEVGLVKIAADAGKQVGLVGRVHDHLQPATRRRQPGLDDAGIHDHRGAFLPLRRRHILELRSSTFGRRLFRQFTAQGAGVPGDFVGLVAHEVADIEPFPQRFVGLMGHGVQRHDGHGFALARLDQRRRIGRAPAQRPQRVAVQVFEQLAFPGVPHLGTGAPDVGHRQQIQGGEVAFVADALGKGVDHVRIAEILFLCHAAHGQVFGHQKLDQLGVFLADAVLAAEHPDVVRTELGVVAPTPFGDVVEQGGHVEDPGLVPASGQLGAKRIFVGVFGDEETPHIAHHHEDVLVHGVDMEQVVLHLPHDMAEHPEIPPQHRGFVHQPQGVRDALGLLQHAQEHGPVGRVRAECSVHHRTGIEQRAQRAGRKALDPQRGLVDQKGFQDGMGLLDVQIVVGHLEHAALVEKALVERASPVHADLVVGQPLLDVEQQNLIQLGHGLGRPVIALHQHFARPADAFGGRRRWRVVGSVARGHHQRRRVGFEAKGLGHRRLQVEHQPVFAPASQQMQARADLAQQGLVGLDLSSFQGRGQAGAGQLVPAVAQARGFGDPQNHLEVAHATGRLLAVGLQRVGRVFELVVALAHLQRLGHKKRLGIHGLVQGVHKLIEQGLVAPDQPRFQQRSLHGDVLGRFRQAFGRGANAGADLQTHVPAPADKGFQPGLERLVLLGLHAVGHEHQHIDIGERKQLAAAITAHRQQRVGGLEAGALPQLAQRLVGEAGQLGQRGAHAPGRSSLDAETVHQALLFSAVMLAQSTNTFDEGRELDAVQSVRPRRRWTAPKRSRVPGGSRPTASAPRSQWA